METKQLHVTPETMLVAIFEIAHDHQGDAKYDEVAERFFARATQNGCAGKQEMEQSLLDHFYALDTDEATAWVLDLLAVTHQTTDEVLQLIAEVFEAHGDRSIRFA